VDSEISTSNDRVNSSPLGFLGHPPATDNTSSFEHYHSSKLPQKSFKLYSPLFIKAIESHRSKSPRRALNTKPQASSSKIISGRVVKRSLASPAVTYNKMATAPTASAPGYGLENQPPEDNETPFAWRENLNTHLICKDCKEFPPNLIEDNAETICGTCGLVLADRLISYESEWRTFNSDEGKGDDPNRVGEAENELLNSHQNATTIAGGTNASKQTRNLQRAQAAQTSDKSNKALMTAYKQIDAWCDSETLGGLVRNTAKSYYKRVDDVKAFRGKSQEAIMASCIFIACRQHKFPRTFSEIFSLTQVQKKELGRTYKALEKFLTNMADANIAMIESQGGIIDREANSYKNTQSTKPEDLCGRFCNQLGMKFRVQAIAQALALKASAVEGLAGRSPLSNASACIYFASYLLGQNTPIRRISEVAGVSDATIKHAYKFLMIEKEKLVDKSWLGNQGQGMIGDIRNLPKSNS
jgi:transcription initiation factor TFIIB